MIDGGALRCLLAQALSFEPVDRRAEKVQLYHIYENVQAVEAGRSSQLGLAFASVRLPYMGTARFGYATWGPSHFARVLI